MEELILLSIATIFEGEKEISTDREFSTHRAVDGYPLAIIDHLQEAYNIEASGKHVFKAIEESEVSSEVELFFEDGDRKAAILIRAVSGYRVDFK